MVWMSINQAEGGLIPPATDVLLIFAQSGKLVFSSSAMTHHFSTHDSPPSTLAQLPQALLWTWRSQYASSAKFLHVCCALATAYWS